MQKMENRDQFRIKSLFTNDNTPKIAKFFTSSNDLGVIRNGGRNGARFAPKAILFEFKKLNFPQSWSQFNFQQFEVCTNTTDFNHMQSDSKVTIKDNIDEKSKLIHLGGGHDHIYPFVSALIKKFNKKIKIINIDAHLDTRTDSAFHSGTPFRQLDSEFSNQIELYQIGIHPFANVESNYREMKCKHIIREVNDINEIRYDLTKFLQEDASDYITVISLDCDALCASQMEAVSAVNHHGIKYEQLFELSSIIYNLSTGPCHLGIYEYNPIYENLSNKGARLLAAYLYNYLNGFN